jgi:uncharacterized protein (TIGR02145 family)
MAMSFTTQPATVPVLTTAIATAISQNAATTGGTVTSDGAASITARGVCWSTTQNPTIGDSKTVDGSGIGIFTSALTELNGNTTYYVRAYATNSAGTQYGNQISFKTNPLMPTISTAGTSSISKTIATSGGNISSDGGATITARGVCWSTLQNPTTSNSKTSEGSGTGSFTSTIIGLTYGTTYYVRAYAINSVGTAYGDMVSIVSGYITDIDGNGYPMITIGTQTWMAENLKTTKYRNGDLIGTTTPVTLDISGESSPKYQWACNGNEGNVAIYGRLYTWYAVTDSRNVCPQGWHIPSDAEWTTLRTFLGGELVAGGKLKETGTTHWLSPNTGATNETGFTALPGGNRFAGTFVDFPNSGYWWSRTEFDSRFAWLTVLYHEVSNASITYYVKYSGYSVRCLMDY